MSALAQHSLHSNRPVPVPAAALTTILPPRSTPTPTTCHPAGYNGYGKTSLKGCAHANMHRQSKRWSNHSELRTAHVTTLVCSSVTASLPTHSCSCACGVTGTYLLGHLQSVGLVTCKTVACSWASDTGRKADSDTPVHVPREPENRDPRGIPPGYSASTCASHRALAAPLGPGHVHTKQLGTQRGRLLRQCTALQHTLVAATQVL